jgi:kanamycin kinase
MTIPTEAASVPDVVRDLAGDGILTPAWRNELGGLTFRVDPGVEGGVEAGLEPTAGSAGDTANGTGTGTSTSTSTLYGTTSGAERAEQQRRPYFVKWMPRTDRATTERVDLTNEAARMRWAAPYTPVPQVLEVGSDDEAQWLVTVAMTGRSAVDPRWLAKPEAAARAIGTGLRALHDALPVDECPWTWSVEDRIAVAEDRAARGHAAAGWSVEARARLADAPEHDRLVVCHGDACAPNTLLDDDGAWAGHVDLGGLGVGDRWADLAVATYSLGWNYGAGYDHLVYEGYGIDEDPDRVAYYRFLWDLG